MRLPLISLALSAFAASTGAAQDARAAFERPTRTIEIPAPESVAIGPDGAWYVSSFGKFDVKGDGAVYRIDPERGTPETYASGLDDPCGLLFVHDTLWVADRQGVYRVRQGKAQLVYRPRDFPRQLHFLNDLAAGPQGSIYVSDTGDSTAAGRGAVFRLTPGKRPTVVTGSDTVRAQSSANGLLPGGGDTLYVVGYRTGVLSVTDGKGSWQELARGLGSPDGIAPAANGMLYISDNVGGDLFLVQRTPGAAPIKLATGLQSPADLVIDERRGLLVVPENSGNRLSVYAPHPHQGH